MIAFDSGYMAPEYAMDGIFSIKSDAFSFGVILLEIISGKKNSGFNLVKHVKLLLLILTIRLISVFHHSKSRLHCM